MARIRTIKPEFWTDETIVKLPFIARILFIGLWNFADDSGGLDYSPDRIRLQILPAEHDCDITGLIDLLEASGLISYWVSEEGTQAISIKNWEKHQKIDNPSRKSVIREGYRKKAILADARVGVAKKYGCLPGSTAQANCYYCGMPGEIQWWNGSNGKPTRWITLSDLEFDHFVSEHSGGDNANGNIVLACRSCNRGKREFDPHQFFAIKNPSVVLDSSREESTLDQGSKDQGSKDHIISALPAEVVKSEQAKPRKAKMQELDNQPAELHEAISIWRGLLKAMRNPELLESFPVEKRYLPAAVGTVEATWRAWKKHRASMVQGHPVTDADILASVKMWASVKMARATDRENPALAAPMLPTMINHPDFVDALIRSVKARIAMEAEVAHVA